MTRRKLLKKQFRKWSSWLLKVNPDYYYDLERLIDYIRGPNWDAADPEFAHYKENIALHGNELLELFEGLRSDDAGRRSEACDMYYELSNKTRNPISEESLKKAKGAE